MWHVLFDRFPAADGVFAYHGNHLHLPLPAADLSSDCVSSTMLCITTNSYDNLNLENVLRLHEDHAGLSIDFVLFFKSLING